MSPDIVHRLTKLICGVSNITRVNNLLVIGALADAEIISDEEAWQIKSYLEETGW